MAHHHLRPAVVPSENGGNYTPVPVVKTYQVGVRQFQSNAVQVYNKKTSSPFNWGYRPAPCSEPEEHIGPIGSVNNHDVNCHLDSEIESAGEEEDI